jgi:hypothetical protein
VAPAWLPVSGTGYVVVTCPMCLRSFSVPTHHMDLGVVRKESCVHCNAEVSYRIDTTQATSGLQPSLSERLHARVNTSSKAIDDSKKMIDDSLRRMKS